MVDCELEEPLTVPVYASQAALVLAADKTTVGKRALHAGAR